MSHLRRRSPGQAGSALVTVLLVLLLLTLLGSAAVQMAQNDLAQAGMQTQLIRATYLAESGLELAIGWFARPQDYPGQFSPLAGPCPTPTRVNELLSRRCRLPSGQHSFLSDSGVSQFQGTAEQPDGMMTIPADSLFSTAEGGIRGATVEVRIFQPRTVGAVCTVLVTAEFASGPQRSIEAELYAVPVPALTAAAAAGVAGPSVGPVRLHWGTLRYEIDGRLPAVMDDLPVQTTLAEVDGHFYQMSGRMDRWMEVVIGGRLLEPIGSDVADESSVALWQERGNVQIGLMPPTDRSAWNYGALKLLARRDGRYYRSDRQGRLYRDGRGSPLSPDQVFTSVDGESPYSIGNFIFIDTVDGQPPRNGTASNLATLTLHRSTSASLAYVAGHVVLSPTGAGTTMAVPSPIVSSSDQIDLTEIHFTGGLYVAGELRVTQESRFFGAVYAAKGFAGTEQLELWYDRRLGTGRLPGWPVVALLPGSWHLVDR